VLGSNTRVGEAEEFGLPETSMQVVAVVVVAALIFIAAN
jgi:hypothetical protein